MQTSLGIFAATMMVVALSFAACSDDASNPANPAAVDGGNPNLDGGGGGTEAATEAAAPAESLGQGPFTLAYAGTNVGIDMRPIAVGKAKFDGAKLISYESSDDERPELGTNQVNEVTGDEFVAIGRWSGGTTAGKFYQVHGDGLIPLPEKGGFHYAIGNFLDPLPASGGGTYSELAKTSATVSDGSLSPGTITGSLAVNFAGATSKIGFSITLEVPGDASYTLATTGGTSDLSTSEAQFASGNIKGAFFANLTVTNAGAACAGSCSGAIDGFVAGPNAERIALVAHVYKGSGGSPKSVAGAIVFKK
jgi:hypothetical protein